MFFDRLFKHAPTVFTENSREGARKTSPCDCHQRSRRMAKVVETLRAERAANATRAARQDEMIASLQQTVAQYARQEPADGRSRETLQQDLAVAMSMLDEFEADALQARAAVEQIEELKAEARVREIIMEELEAELAQWRCPILSAA